MGFCVHLEGIWLIFRGNKVLCHCCGGKLCKFFKKTTIIYVKVTNFDVIKKDFILSPINASTTGKSLIKSYNGGSYTNLSSNLKFHNVRLNIMYTLHNILRRALISSVVGHFARLQVFITSFG